MIMKKRNTNQKFRDQRRRMWFENPFCRKCGIMTILPESVPGAKYKKNGEMYLKKIIPHMATIQHKYCRNHPLRLSPLLHPHEQRRELWCWQCNHDYNKHHENKLYNGK